MKYELVEWFVLSWHWHGHGFKPWRPKFNSLFAKNWCGMNMKREEGFSRLFSEKLLKECEN